MKFSENSLLDRFFWLIMNCGPPCFIIYELRLGFRKETCEFRPRGRYVIYEMRPKKPETPHSNELRPLKEL